MWLGIMSQAGQWTPCPPKGLKLNIALNSFKYVGDFKEGERTGQGILYFIDGTKYIGEWLNNKQHGQGILYSADGEVLTEGNWQNDSFDA